MKAEKPYSKYKLYKVYHKKEERFYAVLYTPKERHTISYARYLMSIKLGRKLRRKESVDHINNIRTDDRIENLQILTPSENTKKSAKGRTYVELVCPECGKNFKRERRKVHKVKHGHPACSRKCGYKLVSKSLIQTKEFPMGLGPNKYSSLEEQAAAEEAAAPKVEEKPAEAAPTVVPAAEETKPAEAPAACDGCCGDCKKDGE